MEKNKFIDFARGFSILTIVLYHYLRDLALPPIIGYAITFGGAGVHLFFFCSGFGLAKSTYTSYLAFLKRRLVKVLIPYFIAITIIFILNQFLKIYPDHFDAYLSHILLFKMFYSKYEFSFGVQFWFLSTIIQFYLVFPLLLFFANFLNHKKVIILSLIISIGYSVLISLSPEKAAEKIWNSFFLQYLWEFMLGMVVSKLNILDKIVELSVFKYVLVALLCIAATGSLAIYGGVAGKNFNDVFSFLAYTSVTVLMYKTAQFYKPLNNLILFIIPISYSLYLVHMCVLDVVRTKSFDNRLPVISIPFILVASIIIAYFFNATVNRILEDKRTVNYKVN